MKTRMFFLFLCGVLLAAGWTLAAGDAGDPLASLSYLTGAFLEEIDARVEERLDKLPASPKQEDVPAVWEETRLKAQDVLAGATGGSVFVLAGSVQADHSGTVVDVTDGSVLPSGAVLTARHRYLVAEDTTARFTVTSKTAVVDHQGSFSMNQSQSVDYNAMAEALKSLRLFRGTLTGYGQGYDLEVSPTRLQALIMFIRVLGEEEQALAWSGTIPFRDIERGSQAEKYVGYAYEKGYTNGYNAVSFRPAGVVNAWQYTEFVLRAMGYSSAANTNLADTLIRAQAAGMLTTGEAAMLERDPFLRAELVYISYYALQAAMPGGAETLGDSLAGKGVFSQRELRDALDMVEGQRL